MGIQFEVKDLSVTHRSATSGHRWNTLKVPGKHCIYPWGHIQMYEPHGNAIYLTILMILLQSIAHSSLLSPYWHMDRHKGQRGAATKWNCVKLVTHALRYVNNTEHLATAQCSARRPWNLPFIWMPTDTNHPPRYPCRSGSPQKASAHPDNCSTTKTAQERLEDQHQQV